MGLFVKQMVCGGYVLSSQVHDSDLCDSSQYARPASPLDIWPTQDCATLSHFARVPVGIRYI